MNPLLAMVRATMFTKACLPLVDITVKQNTATIASIRAALLQYGAFRLAVPQLTRSLSQNVFQDARISSLCTQCGGLVLTVDLGSQIFPAIE